MDNSPLARLPAELRNDIYTLTLVQPGRICFPHTSLPSIGRLHLKVPFLSTDEDKRICPLPPTATALAQTCRQIRQEGTKIFYAENVFQFDLPQAAICRSTYTVNGRSGPTRVRAWLASLYAFVAMIGEKNLEAVSSIIVRLEMISHETEDGSLPSLSKLPSMLAVMARANPQWKLRVLLLTHCFAAPYDPHSSEPAMLKGDLDASKPEDGLHALEVEIRKAGAHINWAQNPFHFLRVLDILRFRKDKVGLVESHFTAEDISGFAGFEGLEKCVRADLGFEDQSSRPHNEIECL